MRSNLDHDLLGDMGEMPQQAYFFPGKIRKRQHLSIWGATTMQTCGCATSHLLVSEAKAMLAPQCVHNCRGLGGQHPLPKCECFPCDFRHSLGGEAGCSSLLVHACRSHRELARWFHLKKNEKHKAICSPVLGIVNLTCRLPV